MLAVVVCAHAWAPAAASETPHRDDTGSQAYRQFVLAYRLMQRGDDELAAEAFNTFADQHPEDPWHDDALFYQASLQRRLGNSTRAQAVLSRVRQTHFAPPYAVHLLQGQLHIDKEQYGEAIRVLKRVEGQELNPAATTVLSYLQGVAYREVGNPRAAAGAFEAASREDSPLRLEALLHLAALQDELDDPQQAIATLKPCLKSDDPETRYAARMLAGRVSVRRAWFDQALEHYQVALDISTRGDDAGEAVLGLLGCQIEAGNNRAAAMTFRRYRSSLSSHDLVMASYLTAVANQRQGLHDHAIGILQGIVAKSFDVRIHDRVMFHTALSWFHKQQYHRAIEALSAFQEQHPESQLEPHARYLYAMACVEAGDLGGAVDQLGPILAESGRHPYHAEALYLRARVHEERGDVAAAAADYESYLSSTGYDQPARLRRSSGVTAPPPQVRVGFLRLLHANHLLGRYTQVSALAGRWMGQVELDPQTAQQIRLRRGLSLIQQGRRQHALEEFDLLLNDHSQSRYRSLGLYYRGLLRLSLGDDDGGVIDLNGALEATSVQPLPPRLVRDALGVLADYYRQAGHDTHAAKVLMRLRAQGEDMRMEPDDLLWLADHYIAREKPKAALKCLKPMLASDGDADPSHRARAMLLAGRALHALGDEGNAAKAIRESIKLEVAESERAHLDLGRVLSSAGRHDEALAELEPLVGTDDLRTLSEVLYEIGRVHRAAAEDHVASDRMKAAKESTLHAVMRFKELTLLPDQAAIAPLGELGYIEMAELYQLTGDEGRALRELEDLRHRGDETSPYTRYAMAMIASIEDRVGDALVWLHGLQEQALDPRLAERVDRMIERWQLGQQATAGGDR